MSTHPFRIVDRLVDSTPLTEPANYDKNANDGKTVVSGILNHSASVLPWATPTASQPSSTGSTSSKPKGNLCPRCGKPVYFAEEIKAVGQSFHKLCYRCANCKKSINGAHFSEHDGELYDNNCYQRLFGPKGVGYGIGAGALSTGT